MIDAADEESQNILFSKIQLHSILNHIQAKKCKLLVVANKIDLENAKQEQELRKLY